ncbi:hypothetical protein, partial [Klebsiella pneumoniae]|uniref:hypothetical protein n=1 Tax=Klebsiella pneumoniae TaxID=573 RepID=UPI003012C1DD
MHNEKIRAWWFAKQGLDQTLSGCSARQIFSKVGWARSVGGANPYLTVHARTGIGRAQMDSDLAAQEI